MHSQVRPWVWTRAWVRVYVWDPHLPSRTHQPQYGSFSSTHDWQSFFWRHVCTGTLVIYGTIMWNMIKWATLGEKPHRIYETLRLGSRRLPLCCRCADRKWNKSFHCRQASSLCYLWSITIYKASVGVLLSATKKIKQSRRNENKKKVHMVQYFHIINIIAITFIAFVAYPGMNS